MTPEQQARFEAEAQDGALYSDGRPKMHRHTFSHDVHRDDECDRGIRMNGAWTSSRRRVCVFDPDALDEHERIIAERAWDEAWKAVQTAWGWVANNPYRKEP